MLLRLVVLLVVIMVVESGVISRNGRI